MKEKAHQAETTINDAQSFITGAPPVVEKAALKVD